MIFSLADRARVCAADAGSNRYDFSGGLPSAVNKAARSMISKSMRSAFAPVLGCGPKLVISATGYQRDMLMPR
jgi:hypothetical protein